MVIRTKGAMFHVTMVLPGSVNDGNRRAHGVFVVDQQPNEATTWVPLLSSRGGRFSSGNDKWSVLSISPSSREAERRH